MLGAASIACMTDIAAIVHSLGGMAQKRQLVRRGARDIDLTRAVRDGDVIRARQGWYTTLPASDVRVRAVRVGGRLTGISAVSALGGWVLGAHHLHVSVPDNAARLRTQQSRFRRLDATAPAGVVVHWDSLDVARKGTRMAVGLLDALHRVLLDESRERAIAAIDWALHSGSIQLFDVEVLLLSTGGRYRIDDFDPGCQSLPESLARTRFRAAGHSVRSQVPISTGESIDLVVDEIVAVEVDGHKYHNSSFVRDRVKDLNETIEGYVALRPPATTVFYDWELVAAAVEAAIAARHPSPHLGNSGLAPRKPPKKRSKRVQATESPEFSNRKEGVGAG